MACCVLLLRLGLVVAPIPCHPDFMTEVDVGGQSGLLGFSRTTEHATEEKRDCITINYGYEGSLIIECNEGWVNASAEECVPRRCLPVDTLAVTLGDLTVGISPLETIFSFSNETQVCRDINPLYRGLFVLFCDYGRLSIDISECVTQWDPMAGPPWQARSRHTAIGLSDGALLLMGGLGEQGPLREVWLWKPTPASLNGTWEIQSLPPWSGRFGAAAVWQDPGGTDEYGRIPEKVMLIGGNDGFNQRDVWRWLRLPSTVIIPLEDSDSTGTQPQDCELLAGVLTCRAEQGVAGRRWTIPYQLWETLSVTIELRYNGSGAEVSEGRPHHGMATITLLLDGCRQTFEMNGTTWSSTGCTGSSPPWSIQNLRREVAGAEARRHEWQLVALHLGRETRQVRLDLGVEGQTIEQDPKIDVGGACSVNAPDEEREASQCGAEPPVTKMLLHEVEVVAWPNASVEIRKVTVTAAPGAWERIADQAPWPGRSSHAAVALPDGDVLVMGGISDTGLMNDVWRWTQQRCTLLPDLLPTVAASYELECTWDCVPSVPYGQWARLPEAPWAPRQEHSAIWSSVGLLLMGGRTEGGFVSDVWRWTYSGDFCSVAWKGQWVQLRAAAPWPQRHGHSIVGFPPAQLGGGGADRVLMIGGFGGQQEHREVERVPVENPIESRRDLWCAHKDTNFTEWVRLAPHAPFSQRTQAAAVVAPTFGDYNLVFFGGYDKSARLVVDMWRWEGENSSGACTLYVN